MNLGDITYAEFSLLRDLVKAKQMDIWKREWAPRLKEQVMVGDVIKSFEEVMGMGDMLKACQKGEVAIPCTDTDCCALLLYRIDEEEKRVQANLAISNK